MPVLRALTRLLNVPALVSFLRSHRADASVWDPAQDLELQLYGRIFGNNFLHYGYFDPIPPDPETISHAGMKKAMDDYATLLVSRVQAGERVLDVGCGMGGLLARLDRVGAVPTGLTPNRSHAEHIRNNWPHIPILQTTLEGLDPAAAAGMDAVINAESFQYADLDTGLARIAALLGRTGRWITIDYFRLDASAKNKSGHLLADFEGALANHRLRIDEKVDVTENMLPTLAYARLLVEGIGLPMLRFTADKFFLGRPIAAYLFQDQVDAKLSSVSLATLDADVFRREKRYILYTIRPV